SRGGLAVRRRLAGEARVVRRVGVLRIVLDGQRTGRGVPGTERVGGRFGGLTSRRESAGRRPPRRIGGTGRAQGRLGAAVGAEQAIRARPRAEDPMSAGAGRQACPGTAARAGQSLRAGHVLRTGQSLRAGPGARKALRPGVTRKPGLTTRKSRTSRERRTLRIPGGVRRRPGRLAARVRGPTGAARALMVHNVERSALLSSGRVDAELSRLTLSRVAVRRRTVRSAPGRGCWRLRFGIAA